MFIKYLAKGPGSFFLSQNLKIIINTIVISILFAYTKLLKIILFKIYVDIFLYITICLVSCIDIKFMLVLVLENFI